MPPLHYEPTAKLKPDDELIDEYGVGWMSFLL